MIIFYIIFTLISFIVVVPFFILSTCSLFFIKKIFSPIFYTSLRFFSRCLLLCFGVWPLINGSFPKIGPYIIMMNHSSFIDILLFPLIPRGKWTGITAVENFNYPILQNILKMMHAIPINRSNKNDAINSIKKAEHVLKDGMHIGIMPEGERSSAGILLPFKKGGFHMALNTRTPILPVGIIGAFRFKPKNRLWIKPGFIKINIGQPVSLDEKNDYTVNQLSIIIKNEIKLLSEELYEN